ncbi:MAG: YceI family protein [Proteobacteria bacterium]|nr:YceI family protein [Pseudomonadota bacterium]
MKTIMAAVVALTALLAAAPVHAWTSDPARSTLSFTATYQGESFQGRFRRFEAKTLDYDPAHLDAARFDVVVDIASIDTANSERDQALPGKDFFDTARFPQAHFVSTRFRKGADGRVLADGTLTLRGVGKPVTLGVTFDPARKTLDVATTLHRLDFGIGGGDWADTSMIGDEVAVHGHLALRP